ncbi:phosphatase PAP2 family protein, partial [Saprospiraceae bacterium]|nr:phosphatase PAP2 family protein [Saprospiraceae bacterium]
NEAHEEYIHYENVYNLDWKKRELLIFGSGVAFTAIGHFAVNRAEAPTLDEINSLTGDDINFIDRGSIGNFSSTAKDASDIVLYSSAALPFLSYFSSKCRANAAPIGVMIAQTFLINNGLTNITKGLVNRFRPYNYNPNAPLELKLGEESRRSFVSGHTSNAAALSFLAARILTDVHIDYSKKVIIWSVAATMPAVVGYLRVKAGRHFPIDVIGGYAVGAAVGYLIPEMHLNKNLDLYVNPAGGIGMNLQF